MIFQVAMILQFGAFAFLALTALLASELEQPAVIWGGQLAKAGARPCSNCIADETVLLQTSLNIGWRDERKLSRMLNETENADGAGVLYYSLQYLESAIKTAYEYCKQNGFVTKDLQHWQTGAVDGRFLQKSLKEAHELRREALKIDQGDTDKKTLANIRKKARGLVTNIAILKVDEQGEARAPSEILQNFNNIVQHVHRTVHVNSKNWHFNKGNFTEHDQLYLSAHLRWFKIPMSNIQLEEEWRGLQIFGGANLLAEIDGVNLNTHTIYEDERALDAKGKALEGADLQHFLEHTLEENIKKKISAIFHGEGNIVKPLRRGSAAASAPHPELVNMPDIEKLRTIHHVVIRLECPEVMLDLKKNWAYPMKACDEVGNLARKLTEEFMDGHLVFEYMCGVRTDLRPAGPPTKPIQML